MWLLCQQYEWVRVCVCVWSTKVIESRMWVIETDLLMWDIQHFGLVVPSLCWHFAKPQSMDLFLFLSNEIRVGDFMVISNLKKKDCESSGNAIVSFFSAEFKVVFRMLLILVRVSKEKKKQLCFVFEPHIFSCLCEFLWNSSLLLLYRKIVDILFFGRKNDSDYNFTYISRVP